MFLNQHTPLLSVTVLNYNYAHYLPQCLDSILGQDFTDFELILINDRSTDNSLDVIQPYLSDPRIRLVDHKENKGFVASLIEGSELSRGKYISVISADDWAFDLRAFGRQISVLEENPNVVMASSAYGLFIDDKTCTFVSRSTKGDHISPGLEAFKDFIVHGIPQHSGTIIRKSAYEAVGGYDKNLIYSLDAQMWLGVCHFGDIAYIDEMFYAYRRHPASMSKSVPALKTAINEVFHIIDWALAFLPKKQQKRFNGLQRRAKRRALSAFAVDAIFSNQYRLGWRFFWVAVQMHPIQTIFQKATLAMIVRTIIGDNLFKKLQQRRWQQRPTGPAFHDNIASKTH